MQTFSRSDNSKYSSSHSSGKPISKLEKIGKISREIRDQLVPYSSSCIAQGRPILELKILSKHTKHLQNSINNRTKLFPVSRIPDRSFP